MKKNVNIPGWPEQFTPTLPDTQSNPFANSLAGGFDFMKNFWSNTPTMVPGLAMPTIDLGELDKRIKDLKAVETWLDMNSKMLRATIQTLEVQRNTVATIQALSSSFTGASQNVSETLANAFKTAASAGRSAAEAPPPATAQPSFWSAPQASPPPASGSLADTGAEARSGLPLGWPTTATPAATAPFSGPTAEPAPAPPSEHADFDRAGRRVPVQKAAAENEPPTDAQAAGQLAFSPNAWLEFLQDQFNKVAAATLAPDSNTKDESTPGGAPAGPAVAAKKTRSAPETKKAATKAAAKTGGSSNRAGGAG